MLTLETLLSEEQIQSRIEELAKIINKDYVGKKITVLCLLKGGIMFMTDLVKRIDIPMKMEFMVVSSYGDDTKSSGIVKILKDLDQSIENEHVLIVEDIIDSGRTLSYIVGILNSRNPASIKICTLLDKPQQRESEVAVDYVGFTIPNEFVIGYGLDYEQYYRNLPYVAINKNSK